MFSTIILMAAALLLAGLINAEKSEATGRILMFKAPLSTLFIVAWALQPVSNPLFSGLILAALILCLGGDVLLAFGNPRSFLCGLVSFLGGHVVYATAFFTQGTTGWWTGAAAMALTAGGSVTWRWLRPHLGPMQLPVLAYIVVISIMVCGAASLAGTTAIPQLARIGVFAGATLFYLSDIFVARQQFVISAHVNRLVGLPLYYIAQFLLAFSAGWISAAPAITS